jgi:hypothetical protein
MSFPLFIPDPCKDYKDSTPKKSNKSNVSQQANDNELDPQEWEENSNEESKKTYDWSDSDSYSSKSSLDSKSHQSNSRNTTSTGNGPPPFDGTMPILTENSPRWIQEMHEVYNKCLTYRLTDQEIHELACHLVPSFGYDPTFETYLCTYTHNVSKKSFVESFGLTEEDMTDKHYHLPSVISAVNKIFELKRMSEEHAHRIFPTQAFVATCFQVRLSFYNQLVTNVPSNDQKRWESIWQAKPHLRNHLTCNDFVRGRHEMKVQYFMQKERIIYPCLYANSGIPLEQLTAENIYSKLPIPMPEVK